jgi:hypothetical protein
MMAKVSSRHSKRQIWAAVIIVIIIVSVVAYFYLIEHESTPVGAFLYLWYGEPTSGVGGLGSPGWNSTSCPGGGVVVDPPVAGYYASDSNKTFKLQVNEMIGAGITFAVVSWWGPFSTGEAGAINNATLNLFKYLESSNSKFQVAVMVDSFPGVCGSSLPGASMSQIYAYVQGKFASPYAKWYFNWDKKPLLLFFNPLQPGSNDNFTVRTIGNRPNAVDWTFWDAPANFSAGGGGTGVNISNDVGAPGLSPDGEVTIVPRIDSYPNFEAGYQSGYLRFDPTLSLGLYGYEWNWVIANHQDVKLVLIYSWNEYHERTAVEPSGVEGSELLNMTATYIAKL